MTNSAKLLLYKIFSFLVYAIPMIALFIINHDEYKSDGSAFGFFGIIILVFIGLTLKNSIATLFKTHTLLTVSIIILVLSLLMKYLGDNMILISCVSIVGSLLQSVIEAVAHVYENYAYITEDGVKKKNMAPAIPDAQAWREAYGFIGR